MPRLEAFVRNDGTVRFIAFAILVTGVLALEYARISLISALVYSRRTRFLIFLAIAIPIASRERRFYHGTSD